jgi:DNA polymerase III delta subunit
MTKRKQIKILEERNTELQKELNRYRSMGFQVREFSFDHVPRQRKAIQKYIVEGLANIFQSYVTIEEEIKDGVIIYTGRIAVAKCPKEKP